MNMEDNFRHCDDYIRDKTQPKCLRKFLLFTRIPAYWQYTRWKQSWGIPTLFATVPAYTGIGGGKYKAKRVRVVMASRFGDVGITTDLTADHGYDKRVFVDALTDFSDRA